jgi:hypothetical protein
MNNRKIDAKEVAGDFLTSRDDHGSKLRGRLSKGNFHKWWVEYRGSLGGFELPSEEAALAACVAAVQEEEHETALMHATELAYDRQAKGGN